MAHLTKPTKYNIEDSNIALLGSDLEKRVREHAGDIESAWSAAGKEEGTQIWRIEKFKVVSWSKKGEFYQGDSYIVLHTYKKTPEAKSLSYDLHFWLGQDTSQDEAATAAYKTVELDDHLKGTPVEYREIQGHESARFLSYFPRFITRDGGIATGFHHVTAEQAAPDRLFRISVVGHNVSIRQVPATHESLATWNADVFVFDKPGKKEIWQYNTKGSSVVKERAKAAEFVAMLREEKEGDVKTKVFDEGSSGIWEFLESLQGDAASAAAVAGVPHSKQAPTAALFKLSDASGQLTFSSVHANGRPTLNDLNSGDAFILDYSPHAVYIWIGRQASTLERKLATEYAQQYLWKKGGRAAAATPIVRVNEGGESEEFMAILS